VVYRGHTVPTDQILAIKRVRESIGELSLADALVLVEAAPSVLLVGATRSAAETVRGSIMDDPPGSTGGAGVVSTSAAERMRRMIASNRPEGRIWVEIVPNNDLTKDHRYVNRLRGLTCRLPRWRPPE